MFRSSDYTVEVNLQDLENTLNFIADKVESVYKREVKAVIRDYLEEIKKGVK